MHCYYSLTRAVDPVNVDVYGGPPEHEHDGAGVLLLDLVLEDHLVGEADAALARVLAGEHAGATAHLGFGLNCSSITRYKKTLSHVNERDSFCSLQGFQILCVWLLEKDLL